MVGQLCIDSKEISKITDVRLELVSKQQNVFETFRFLWVEPSIISVKLKESRNSLNLSDPLERVLF